MGKCPDKSVHEEETYDTCDDICRRLCDLDTGQAEQGSTEQQERYRDGAASDHGEERGDPRFLYALVKHIDRNGQRHEHHTDRTEPHRGGTDPDNVGMGLEKSDDEVGEDDADEGHSSDEYDAESHGEEHAVFDTAVFLRLMIEGRHGLESLAHTESNAHQERCILVYDTHGCDRGIAKGLRNIIEHTGGRSIESLTDQGGEAYAEYLKIRPGILADIHDIYLALCHTDEHDQKDSETDHLRNSGRKACAEDAHIEPGYQYIVTQDIQ